MQDMTQYSYLGSSIAITYLSYSESTISPPLYVNHG